MKNQTLEKILKNFENNTKSDANTEENLFQKSKQKKEKLNFDSCSKLDNKENISLNIPLDYKFKTCPEKKASFNYLNPKSDFNQNVKNVRNFKNEDDELLISIKSLIAQIKLEFFKHDNFNFSRNGNMSNLAFLNESNFSANLNELKNQFQLFDSDINSDNNDNNNDYNKNNLNIFDGKDLENNKEEIFLIENISVKNLNSNLNSNLQGFNIKNNINNINQYSLAFCKNKIKKIFRKIFFKINKENKEKDKDKDKENSNINASFNTNFYTNLGSNPFTSSEILSQIISLCHDTKFFSELLKFYLNNKQIQNSINLVLTEEAVFYNDYEDCIFIYSEFLLKNPELTSQILNFLIQEKIDTFSSSFSSSFSRKNACNFYPIFSLLLKKLLKKEEIEKCLSLVNHLMMNKIEISSNAINLLLEFLGQKGRLNDGLEYFNKFLNFVPMRFFPENLKLSNLNLNQKLKKSSLTTGISLISYGIIMKYLCKNNLIDTALNHYEILKVNNLLKDEVIFNILIDGCSKSSNLDYLKYIYEDMIYLNIKPNIITYNTIIDSFIRLKDIKTAWKIYEDLLLHEIEPDNFTYSTLFRGIRYINKNNNDNYSNEKNYIAKAFEILDNLANKNKRNLRENENINDNENASENDGNKIDIILINVFMDSCIFIKDTESLQKLFNIVINGFGDSNNNKNIVTPDLISFNTYIKACAQLDLFQNAINAFEKLMELKDIIKPNNVSFNTMIDVCVRNERIDLVWGIIEIMKNQDIMPDNFTYSTIIKGINKKTTFKNQINKNRNKNKENNNNNNNKVKNDKKTNYKNKYKYENRNNIKENEQENKNKYKDYENENRNENHNKDYNYNSYNNSNSYSDSDSQSDSDCDIDLALKLFENVKVHSKPDEILYNVIMDACLRFNKINKMYKYFNEMISQNIKPSSITYGILIKAYGIKGQLKKVFEIYEKMKVEKVEISSITFGCLLNACIKNNDLEKAFEIYQEICDKNFQMNIILYTTIIKAYSKKNNLQKVLEIFEKMKSDSNNQPNNITFNSIIDCCINCNDLKKAEEIFMEMKTKFGSGSAKGLGNLVPDIISFSTIIKGCLKSSKLEKAVNYLNEMIGLKIIPDEVLLNSFLDGCEKLGEFNKAKEIFLRIRKLGTNPSMMSFSIMMKVI
jgi:pentatricopeptide repeat protein